MANLSTTYHCVKINSRGTVSNLLEMLLDTNVKELASGKQQHSTGISAQCFEMT